MNIREKSILINCKHALESIPHKRNLMSSRGASAYDEDMKHAIGLFNRVVDCLTHNETKEAEDYSIELCRYAIDILLNEQLIINNYLMELATKEQVKKYKSFN